MGTSVKATELLAVPEFPAETTTVAVYANSEGKVAAAILADLAIADICGAALCLIPSTVAETCVKAGNVDPALLENFHEVLNICAQLFKGLDETRMVLQSVCYLPDLDSAEARNLMSATARRLSLQVWVTGYGEGNLAVFS